MHDMMDMEVLASRMDCVEATVARLAAAVDGMVETIVKRVVDAVDERSHAPIVMTKAQLANAVKDAMASTKPSTATAVSPQQGPQSTPPRVATTKTLSMAEKKKPTTQRIEPEPISPPMMSLSMFDSEMTSFITVDQPPLPQHVPAPRASPVMVAQRPPKPAAAPRPRAMQPPPPQMNYQAQDAPADGRLYLWGNAWHHLPEDYDFPKESMDIMWRQWCCGDVEKGYQPLRLIQGSDIASANNRKRFSDLKFLMKHIEQNLQECGVWKETPSQIEADQMLRAVRDRLPIATTTGKGQKRELEGMKWLSVVTLLRGGANKKAKIEA